MVALKTLYVPADSFGLESCNKVELLLSRAHSGSHSKAMLATACHPETCTWPAGVV